MTLVSESNLIDKVFNIKDDAFKKVKVIDFLPKEPSLFPNSPWESLIT